MSLAGSVRGRLLDVVALAGPVLVVVVVTASAASAPSRLVPASHGGFPGWLAGLVPGLLGEPRIWVFKVALLALLAFYLVAVSRAQRLGVRAVMASVVAAHVVLLLGPPLASGDVFGYIGYARLGALHGLSPYEHSAVSLGGDAVGPFVLWHDKTTPYGPGFTLLSYAFVPLGVGGSLWAFKVLAVAASLACVAIVARTAGRLGRSPAWAAAFVGLNPILLVFAVGGAHNDLLVAMLTAAALAFLVGRRPRAGAAFIVLAGSVKASALLVLPFVLATPPRRRKLAAAAVAAAVALPALLVFGSTLTGLVSAIADQQHLVAARSVPAQLGSLLGLGGLTAGLRALSAAVLAAVIAIALRRAWHEEDPVPGAGWATLALLATTAWLLPWYLVWLLPLAAVAGSRRLEWATLAFTAYLMATRVVA
jgi:alpha-1,6-mannosyltransferase